MKIISTVPSITELLADLGLKKEVVGITKFCVHPNAWYKTKKRIGGTKTLDIEKIKSLQPDLIIANKEENVKEQIEALMDSCDVYLTDIKKPEDNLQLIKEVGIKTNTRMTAIRIQQEMQDALALLSSTPKVKNGLYPNHPSSAYLIWQNPYMTVGHDTYIHGMMKMMGIKNVFSNESRYPETTIDELKRLAPDVIMLSSEPFPFAQKHVDNLQSTLTNARVILVDGEAFSWYGTRLIKKASYLVEVIASVNNQV